MWFRNGNCFVHLYGRGQSKRGPAFKVPFSTLLATKCHPLVERFMLRQPSRDGGPAEIDFWSKANLLGRVDLYIPPPPGSNKQQATEYHLATRNFFAWVFRRSMVGEHLGSALVGLLNSMHEFRLPDGDHIRALLEYLDEEGYLDMRNQPSHALAMLRLAETFQLKDLYIDAFAHCAGMNDRLYLSAEYQVSSLPPLSRARALTLLCVKSISSVSRKLIRRARVDMDVRLGRAGDLLRNFLEDDLSEANLGLSPAARTHIDRFRTFLLGFYATRRGYYPPPSVDRRSTMFETRVYQAMSADFQALYEYLVDDSFTSTESSPFLAQGGICTLQSVEAFDTRHKFSSLPNPLPLLPEIAAPTSSRRLSWLGKADKQRPDGRLIAHAAAMKATNKRKIELFGNSRVCAFRKFEEDCSFSPHKADRLEKISHVDGRKVRWILIYGVYQVLRNCTHVPAQVTESTGEAYNLAISTANLPPWKEQAPAPPYLVRSQTDAVMRTPSLSTGTSASTPSTPPVPITIDIRPDIDYFALTRHQPPPPATVRTRSFNHGPPVIPPRSRSLSRNTSKSGTFRRPLRLFRSSQASDAPAAAAARPRRPSYHEIVVRGYGNGTNNVNMPPGDVDTHQLQVLPTTATTASRSSSTASNSSTGSANTAESKAASTPDAPDSPATDYSPSRPQSAVGDEEKAPPSRDSPSARPAKEATATSSIEAPQALPRTRPRR